MHFASDNAGPVHPRILDAIAKANEGYAGGYGSDPLSLSVVETIREIFEAPEAAVYLVPTGTAANALALATLCAPWQTVFCTEMSHINVDECNAPEFYTGGAKLTLVPDVDAKMTPDALRAAIVGEETRGVHGPQRGPVSITQVTETGTVHSLDEIRALTAVAREFDLPVHLDGARFANALVSLGCTPAEMTWKAGVDAVSFGGTKNGCMGVEAVILFDPKKAWEFELRRKRGAHLFSKHRYLAAQMAGYLEGGLWRDLATRSNAAAARLAAGLIKAGIAPINAVDANIIFFRAPRSFHARLMSHGATYYTMEADAMEGDPEHILTGRLVTDWSRDDAGVDAFLALLT